MKPAAKTVPTTKFMTTAFNGSALAGRIVLAAVVSLGMAPALAFAGSITGRTVPAPLYGVTLDNVDNSVLYGELLSLSGLPHVPTARVNFDPGMSPSWYLPQVRQLRSVSYIMGQLIDSSEMCQYTAKSATNWAQKYTATLTNNVDIWEVGNEINGNWLCNNAFGKMAAMYNVVAGQLGRTALTFFY